MRSSVVTGGLALFLAAGAFGEEVFFTTPSTYTIDENVTDGNLLEQRTPGAVFRLDSESAATSLTEDGLGFGVGGLALDISGNVYAAVLQTSGFGPIGFKIDLIKIDPAGVTTTLVTLLDEPNAFGSLTLNGADLAFGPDEKLYYITPRVYEADETGAPVPISATIGRIDLDTLATETVSTGFPGGVAGLAFGPDGDLFFGSSTPSAGSTIGNLLELVRVDTSTGGQTVEGVLFDAIFANNTYNFDLTISEDGQVFFTTPRSYNSTVVDVAGIAIEFPGDVIRLPGIDVLDLATGAVSTALELDLTVEWFDTEVPVIDTAGITIEEDGSLLFGATSGILTIDVFRLPVEATEPTLVGRAFDVVAGAPDGSVLTYSLAEQRFELAANPHLVEGLIRIPDELADINGDGIINIVDLLEFLSGYFAGAADLNGDGVTNIMDLLDFLEIYLTA